MDSTDRASSECDLTSTMGGVLSSSNVESAETPSDSTPSSSSDANTHILNTETATDDPISSTSDTMQPEDEVKEDKGSPSKSSVDHEVDMFASDLNISATRSEKITEDVEDIVHDLENLLDQSAEEYHSISNQNKTSDSDGADVDAATELDNFLSGTDIPAKEADSIENITTTQESMSECVQTKTPENIEEKAGSTDEISPETEELVPSNIETADADIAEASQKENTPPEDPKVESVENIEESIITTDTNKESTDISEATISPEVEPMEAETTVENADPIEPEKESSTAPIETANDMETDVQEGEAVIQKDDSPVQQGEGVELEKEDPSTVQTSEEAMETDSTQIEEPVVENVQTPMEVIASTQEENVPSEKEELSESQMECASVPVEDAKDASKDIEATVQNDEKVEGIVEAAVESQEKDQCIVESAIETEEKDESIGETSVENQEKDQCIVEAAVENQENEESFGDTAVENQEKDECVVDTAVEKQEIEESPAEIAIQNQEKEETVEPAKTIETPMEVEEESTQPEPNNTSKDEEINNAIIESVVLEKINEEIEESDDIQTPEEACDTVVESQSEKQEDIDEEMTKITEEETRKDISESVVESCSPIAEEQIPDGVEKSQTVNEQEIPEESQVVCKESSEGEVGDVATIFDEPIPEDVDKTESTKEELKKEELDIAIESIAGPKDVEEILENQSSEDASCDPVIEENPKQNVDEVEEIQTGDIVMEPPNVDEEIKEIDPPVDEISPIEDSNKMEVDSETDLKESNLNDEIEEAPSTIAINEIPEDFGNIQLASQESGEEKQETPAKQEEISDLIEQTLQMDQEYNEDISEEKEENAEIAEMISNALEETLGTVEEMKEAGDGTIITDNDSKLDENDTGCVAVEEEQIGEEVDSNLESRDVVDNVMVSNIIAEADLVPQDVDKMLSAVEENTCTSIEEFVSLGIDEESKESEEKLQTDLIPDSPLVKEVPYIPSTEELDVPTQTFEPDETLALPQPDDVVETESAIETLLEYEASQSNSQIEEIKQFMEETPSTVMSESDQAVANLLEAVGHMESDIKTDTFLNEESLPSMEVIEAVASLECEIPVMIEDSNDAVSQLLDAPMIPEVVSSDMSTHKPVSEEDFEKHMQKFTGEAVSQDDEDTEDKVINNIINEVEDQSEDAKVQVQEKMEVSAAQIEEVQPEQVVDSSTSVSRKPKKVNEPLSIEISEVPSSSVDEEKDESVTTHREKSEYSSKISESEDLKMTITKQKPEESNSILKIYQPDEGKQLSPKGGSPRTTSPRTLRSAKDKELVVPKLIIKTSGQQKESPTESEPSIPKLTIKRNSTCESQHSPKLTVKNASGSQGSPKITIKPVVKPQEPMSPLKLTIKTVVNVEEMQQKPSPKLTIKPIVKPDEEHVKSTPKVTIKPVVKKDEPHEVTTPKITIKPIVKPAEPSEAPSKEVPSSPKITIKPIYKPVDEVSTTEFTQSTPKITIKPIQKPSPTGSPTSETPHSPRITIKPIVKPPDYSEEEEPDCEIVKTSIEPPLEQIDFEEEIKERIVLKINVNQKLSPNEKLDKIKVKLSKEGGHPQIVGKKRSQLQEALEVEEKRPKLSNDDNIITIEDDESNKASLKSSEEEEIKPTIIQPSSQAPSCSQDIADPLEEIPVFKINSKEIVGPDGTNTPMVQAPAPRKRGRPRKIPLVVREEFRDPPMETDPTYTPDSDNMDESSESGRPKRSCRGFSARTTLGLKPRKPRGRGGGRGGGRGSRGGRGRGRGRGVGKPAKATKLSAAKLKLLADAVKALEDGDPELEFGNVENTDSEDVEMKAIDSDHKRLGDVALYEEETRMSADNNSSRGQTPAKQVQMATEIEESQSSVQSTATTESGTKVKKPSKHEVHQEPEGTVISAEQLAEYCWGGGGPYMLQEQVAQFLGIKSFKRKYPGIARRQVDMQERDFIKESGLVSESMCDLGLTAVNSADILDIMYSDFQHKYEEYCKFQRDRQAKDFSNKQKALSLAAKQESNKVDITQQAVRSAAQWNTNFNRSRKEQRRACMDLQTFTINYPKGRIKTIDKPKIGHYPLALVPGQYTDYYKSFTPTELNNLPLNTMCYDPINIPQQEEESSDSSSSSSGSSSSSDSDSSSSDSSDGEECTECDPPANQKNVLAH